MKIQPDNLASTTEESRVAWEANAEFWDNYMGDESNFFHCDLLRPVTDKLLDAREGELILDIACGNGNYSAYLAERGVRVVAFDYSPRMVELAKRRRSVAYPTIEFHTCDATKSDEIISVVDGRGFDKAVANMALMDISDIEPLFRVLSNALKPQGSFVFSMHHPCFTAPNEDYLISQVHKGIAVEGQPMLQNYYHNPFSYIFNVAFKNGFVVDGFEEIPFEGESEPIIMVVRARNQTI
ncbi:MAG: class I SAM-dependent methyltransferase [Rikenellaceae bacterium]